MRDPTPGRPSITIENLWSVLPYVVLLALSMRHPLRLLDFWWHLKVGQIIFTERQIPTQDMFSFTALGTPFLHQNWLAELLYYVIYWVGGFEILILLNSLLLVAAFRPVYRLTLQRSPFLKQSVLASLLAAIPLGLYSNVRPQTFSFFFFSVYLSVLWTHYEGKKARLWILPLLMVPWANTHGAFVLGLLVIGVFLFDAVVQSLTSPGKSPTRWKHLAGVFAMAGVASLVNPHGYRVYEYIVKVVRDPGSQQFVTEWQPPQVTQLSGISCFFAGFFISLLIFLYSRKSLWLPELLLFLGFSVFALTAVRNGIWFALVIPPIVARSLAGTRLRPALRKIRMTWAKRFGRSRSAAFVEPPAAVQDRLNALLAIIMLAAVLVTSPWLYPYVFGTTILEEDTPIGVMDFIQERGLTGNIYHPQIYGDYLIWRLWPQQKSFVDGRVHLYPESLIVDHGMVLFDSCWEQRLAKYDIRLLLLHKPASEAADLIKAARQSPGWNKLYEDDKSILFEKVD